MIKKATMNNIYDLIDLIEERPEVYLGDAKISSFNTFINGYQFSTIAHNINQEQVFPPFWYFNEWAMHKYDWRESTAGWKNIILEENQNDEELALVKCFELLKEFRTLKPISIQRSKLDKTNIEFHHSEDCKIKILLNYAEQLKGPVYEDADEIFIIEFSYDFGFSIFVRLNGKSIGIDWRKRFKTLEETIAQAEILFGKSLKWENLTGDLIKRGRSIIRS